MNAILEETIRLACLIRNSAEAEAWRRSWENLTNIWSGEQMSDVSEDMPFNEFVYHVRMTDQAQTRPLLFPFILGQLFVGTETDFDAQINQHPAIRNSLGKLFDCLALTRYIITFLRGVGTGFPHNNLIYTVPDTPWMRQSSYQELPWNLSQFTRLPTDARLIGLDRFIPSIGTQVAENLNRLAAAIREDSSWHSLDRAYKTISQNRNILNELDNSINHFRRLVSEAQAKAAPVPIKLDRVQSITDQVYRKKGDRINNYVDSFLGFDKIIERIYWLISHVIIYKTITFLNSADQETLQQINISPGEEQYITAVSPTMSNGVRVGRIIHLSLPEVGDTFDGLYQITNTHQKYQAGNRLRLFLGAESLWSCSLSNVQYITSQMLSQIFIPSEKADFISGIRLDIGGSENSFSLKELISLELSQTMNS